jgi:hypothetical protein
MAKAKVVGQAKHSTDDLFAAGLSSDLIPPACNNDKAVQQAIYREELLQDAIRTVVRDRNSTYGTPEDSFNKIADLWNVLLNKKLKVEHAINPTDVALMMTLLKVARLIENPEHYDSWVDIAGYASCGADVTLSAL